MKQTEETNVGKSTRSNRLSGRVVPSSGWRGKAIWFIGLAGIVIAALIAFRPKTIRVEIGQVTQGPLVVSVLEEGQTRVRNRYVISPPIPGLLRRTSLREGDPVIAGETVVLTLETQPSTLLDPRAKERAEAAVAAAESALRLREAEVGRAVAALDLVEKEFVRGKKLVQDGVLSMQEWDRVDAEKTVRERELRASEFAVGVAEFELKRAQAALVQPESLGNASSRVFKLHSPVDGFVLNLFEENSRTVEAGTPLMEVGDLNDLEIEIELLSQDAVNVKQGTEISIEHWGGDVPLKGRVSGVLPAAYTRISALGVEEQRVTVRADFVERVPSGTTLGDRYRIEARVVTGRSENALRVPAGALFRRGGEWMVYQVLGNQAQIKAVTVGLNNGEQAEVHEGLSLGDRVINYPPALVKNGVRVRERTNE